MKRFMTSMAVALAFMVSAVASPAANAQDRNFLNDLIGRGLGAYGAAKLCGGGASTKVACGAMGSELGSQLLAPREQNTYQYNDYNRYQRYDYNRYYAADGYEFSQRYETRDKLRPRVQGPRPCHSVLMVLPDGRSTTATSCLMPNGTWQIVSYN